MKIAKKRGNELVLFSITGLNECDKNHIYTDTTKQKRCFGIRGDKWTCLGDTIKKS